MSSKKAEGAVTKEEQDAAERKRAQKKRSERERERQMLRKIAGECGCETRLLLLGTPRLIPSCFVQGQSRLRSTFIATSNISGVCRMTQLLAETTTYTMLSGGLRMMTCRQSISMRATASLPMPKA